MKDILESMAEEHNIKLEGLKDNSQPIAITIFNWELPNYTLLKGGQNRGKESTKHKRSWDNGTWRGYYG